MRSSQTISKANSLLAQMQDHGSLEIGLELSKLIMESITAQATGITLDDVQDSGVLDVIGLGNTKMEHWFKPHPYLGGHFSAFQLFDFPESKVEAKFYHLNDRVVKRIIAGGVQLTPNWEDSGALTRNGEWKVGIDFFLTEDCTSLLMVASLEGNLRVVEFSTRLTSTQVDLMDKIAGAGDLSNHEAIHASIWNAFGMREVNKEFYEGVASFFEELLQKLVDSGREPEDAKLFSSRLLGRLLFVWFLRKKELINESLGYFEPDGQSSAIYYANALKPLFFETLNTPIKERLNNRDSVTPYLNGGLFEIHENDWHQQSVEFPTGYFTRLYEHFNRFNFTTDESSPDYEQVAIDPEMLGRVFESLLATQVAETGASARKANGAFYTPREVVAYMCKETLRQYLYSKLDNPAHNAGVDKLLDASDADVAKAHSNFVRDLWGQENRKVVVAKVQAALDDLKVLDPACGSGAFPLGMVQVLTRVMERLDSRFDPFKTKLSIIKNSIYGVDIEPMAIEIAKLRTWLSLVVDEADSMNIVPLPNLDFKYVCANSLISLAPKYDGLPLGVDTTIEERLSEIRDEYFNTSSKTKKDKLRRNFVELTTASFDDLSDIRLNQLKTFNPFDYSTPANFFDPQQMFGVEGFGIVIGNPPYIGEKGNKPTFDKLRNSGIFKRFYQGRADIFHYFFHLGIDCLAEEGILSFITTNYFPTATHGSNLRTDLSERTRLLALVNFNELKVFESALGQHNMITLLQRTSNNKDYKCKQIMAVRQGNLDSHRLNELLSGTSDLGICGEIHVSQLFEGLEKYIRFISNSGLDSTLEKMSVAGPLLGTLVSVSNGVQTGMNFFTKSWAKKFPDITMPIGSPVFVFPAGTHRFEHLRPWFKSSQIFPFVTEKEPSWEILWFGRGEPKPSSTEETYLKQFKPMLQSRREFISGVRPWYELHWPREEMMFIGPKIVAPYRTYTNRFAYSDSEFFGATDITFLTEKPGSSIDLFFLLGLLNSDLLYAWFYFRGKRKGQMLELLQVPISEVPIPRNSLIEMEIAKLAKESFEVLSTNPKADVSRQRSQINSHVHRLYSLTASEIEALSEFVVKQSSVRNSILETDSDDDDIGL